MIAPTLLQHIRHQLRRNRRPTLILLVLPRIRKKRNDGRDPLRARDLARVYHDAKLHERRVDRPAAGVDDVHVVFANGLDDAHVRFADAAAGDVGFGDGDAEAVVEGVGRLS